MVGKVFPEAASTHFPLIKSFVADTFTLGSITVVAVAMVVPPSPILIPMPLLGPLAAASGPLVQSLCSGRSLGRPLLRGSPAYTPAPPESINPINRIDFGGAAFYPERLSRRVRRLLLCDLCLP